MKSKCDMKCWETLVSYTPINADKKYFIKDVEATYVSRKHLSVVNFGGNLYMQDRSTNGTGMREGANR